MATLRITTGPAQGQSIECTRELVVGREGVDFVVDDGEMSRRHAILRPGAGGIEIEDLGSLNGTYVNGQRISGVATLTSSAQLKMGTTEFAFEVSQADLPVADPQRTVISSTPSEEPIANVPQPTAVRPTPPASDQPVADVPQPTAVRPTPPASDQPVADASDQPVADVPQPTAVRPTPPASDQPVANVPQPTTVRPTPPSDAPPAPSGPPPGAPPGPPPGAPAGGPPPGFAGPPGGFGPPGGPPGGGPPQIPAPVRMMLKTRYGKFVLRRAMHMPPERRKGAMVLMTVVVPVVVVVAIIVVVVVVVL